MTLDDNVKSLRMHIDACVTHLSYSFHVTIAKIYKKLTSINLSSSFIARQNRKYMLCCLYNTRCELMFVYPKRIKRNQIILRQRDSSDSKRASIDVILSSRNVNEPFTAPGPCKRIDADTQSCVKIISITANRLCFARLRDGSLQNQFLPRRFLRDISLKISNGTVRSKVVGRFAPK